MTTLSGRTPLVVVCGYEFDATCRAATMLLARGTAVVEYDLRRVNDGDILRTIRTVGTDGLPATHCARVELEHGCVSCALREDLLPLLRSLHRRGNVERIVLALDPMIEPEPLSWAITNTMVVGMPGQIDAPAGRDVRVEAVIGCVELASWFDNATGDITLAEAGGHELDDERTVAQIVVGHVDFADVLLATGAADDGWTMARTFAVLKRLAPTAPMLYERPDRPLTSDGMERLLTLIPEGSRRGRVYGPHDNLLSGQPPLDSDCGVQLVEFFADRPFHPGRLHDAVDVLLDGVVAARGRLWLATQPDEALWLESAGGGLRVATGGPWLAAMGPQEASDTAAIEPERVALASLRWSPEFGDRHSAIVVLSHRADPIEIQETLRHACLTDEEMAAGSRVWSGWADPFGHFHADPCADPGDDHDDELSRYADNTAHNDN